MKRLFESYRLEMVVFLSGAIGMVIEIVGSRVVAPYFGNSLIVWTSLIGVILGCLSLGYYFGGRLADKNQNQETLARILLFAGVLIGLSAFLKEVVLTYLSFLFGNELKSASFTAVLLLFGPTSFLLGIIAPYAARLKLTAIRSSGSVVGSLYALSTLGSIGGTFLAGFYLIPMFGNTVLFFGLAIALMIVSALSIFRVTKEHVFFCLAVLFLFYLSQKGIFKINALADIDSLYSRILVRAVKDQDGKSILTLSTDSLGIQSAYDINNPDDLYFEYAKAYSLSDQINPKINEVLVIGGGGFTYPRYFLKQNPSSSVDIVEIDPKMTELAKKYFLLKDDDPRMAIFHEDARSFLRRTEKNYDAIYLDAFNSLTPPAHLTTLEFFKELDDRLRDKGFLMINLISATGGNKSGFLKAETATLLGVFPKVEAFALSDRKPDEVQNILVIAYKEEEPERTLELARRLSLNLTRKIVLTDDYSPVEYLTKDLYVR